MSSTTRLTKRFASLFPDRLEAALDVRAPNFIVTKPRDLSATQSQTREAFSNKWSLFEYETPDFKKSLERQKQWYLELYGFESESELARYLSRCRLVLDAGAGKCGKAAWFAGLSPSTTVVAADISDSLVSACEHYKDHPNLLFVQCDIGQLPFFSDGFFDYVSCDQVIHHTADPYRTFQELVRVTRSGGDLSVYVYRKKALPRELLDGYFREYSRTLSHDQLMELSQQLTDLGRLLSSIKDEIDIPGIPLLGIEGGKMSVQRFLYWNFLKCYWNEELGAQSSLVTNYDWYSPSQAFRYLEEEFRSWIETQSLSEIHFHAEQACYSGRFRKP